MNIFRNRGLRNSKFLILLTLSYLITPQKAFCVDNPTKTQNASAFELSEGNKVYSIYCAACHGDLGDGNGPAAVGISPAPRDFTSGVYKFRSTPTGSLPTDEDLIKVVQWGIPGTWMPGWKGLLSEQEINNVVTYCKSFFPEPRKWNNVEPISSLIESPPQPNSELLRDGEGFYLLFDCWQCHGFDGRGSGPSAKKLIDSNNRPIKPTNLTKNNYRAGFSPKDIRKTFLTGLSGSPMPSYKDIFLIAKEDVEAEEFSKLYPSKSKKTFFDYQIHLPSSSYINSLTENEQKALMIRNEWALVHYVRSLVKKDNLIDWFFRNNPESESLKAKK
ncbi:MAG: c-type cytochrome [Candidatus Marinimicrobia bacterium]|nr:c-type cytochrome [Bacteroidota bacterium]MCH7763361.1 c-type cytochrome [Candidatus Neomarinimicrobiota bacterium]